MQTDRKRVGGITSCSLRCLLALLGTASVCVSCGGQATGIDEASSGANTILITLDTTRPDYMGCYGFGGDFTPNMDGLARAGVRFGLALSSSSVTPVAHASILTGQFPYSHGVRVMSAGSGYRLPNSTPYLATELKRAGYYTAAVHSAFPVSSHFGFERDFDSFQSCEGSIKSDERKGFDTWDALVSQRRSDETINLALDLLPELPEPFFLWIHLWDPHDNKLMPPQSFMDPFESYDFESLGSVAKLYAIEMMYMDAQLGRLFSAVEAFEFERNFLWALTADHGQGLVDGMRDHQWSNHRLVYQEQIQVPLILQVPGVAAGGIINELVRTVDLAPTLLDYLGVAKRDLELGANGKPGVLDAMDGRSLRELIEGHSTSKRVAYADQINGYDRNASMVAKRPKAAFLHCLVDGDWKLIYRPHSPGASELFHLAEDPDELDNLFLDQAEISKRLLEDLAGREPWVLEPFKGEEVDEGLNDVLGQLGYTEGELDSSDWHWTCPQHSSTQWANAQKCAECGGNPIPLALGTVLSFD